MVQQAAAPERQGRPDEENLMADSGSERHLATLLGMKNKAAYTHEPISAAECKKMNRAAGNLVETARRAVAFGRHRD